MSPRILPLTAALLVMGCRPELGTPDYPDPPPWGGDTGGDFLLGPDPYEDGEARLSMGYFYEGEASEVDAPENLYIYSDTFTIGSSDDRVEGYISDVWVHAGQAWWGGGLHWDAARDLSAWTTMNIAMMAPAEGGIAALDIALQSDDKGEGRLTVSDYGFAADGSWHQLVIPLDDFVTGGADLSRVIVPLILVGEGGAAGDQLFIDNLYLE